MGNFLKKDMLLILRDKKELVILILMPFLLIAILGFSLSGIVNGGALNLQVKFILVNEDDEAGGRARLIEEIRSSGHIPEDMKKRLEEAASGIDPQGMLHALLESESFASVAQYRIMGPDDARKELNAGEAAAIVHLPSDFTYRMLKRMLLEEGESAVIHLEGSSDYALSAGILQDILESFSHNVNVQIVMNRLAGETGAEAPNDGVPALSGSPAGGLELVNTHEPMNSIQYYTMGMAVMFVMYVVTSMSSKAFAEKTQFTYDRIIIAGTRPLHFVSGKFASTVILAIVQVVTLFGLSTLVFGSFAGKSLEFWTGMLVVTIALALCMGGLATLLTSLNFRVENEASTQVFNGLVVTLFAFVGGSFIPISQMADWVNAIGGWTPNGSALFSFMQVAQGAGFERYGGAVLRLIMMAAVFTAAGVWLFPRRRAG